MGYIILSKPKSSGNNSSSGEQREIWRELFPNASDDGIGLDDLPLTAPDIVKFIKGPQSGIVSRLISRQGSKAKINYDLLTEEFNQRFWLRNFIKCLVISRFAKREIQKEPEFIDVGGGIGPFALAVSDVTENVSITIHDSSRKQEQLFKELRRHELIPPQIHFRHNRVNLDFFSRTKSPRLFSYVLCENQDFVSSKARVLDVIGNFTVLVDYWKIVEPIAEAAYSAGLNVRLLKKIEIPLESQLARVVGQDSITVSGGVFQR